jgi:hypothetical protein
MGSRVGILWRCGCRSRNVFARLTVIPANAGIQFKHAVRSTRYSIVLSASHDVFVLDSGVRRNDGEGY